MKVLLASILLEPRRWQPGRPSSLKLSDWSGRAADAGFAGWELFENHYRQASAEEQRKLADGPLPVRIYNTYEAFDHADRPALGEVADHVGRLGATALKFNLGTDRSTWPQERACVAAMAARLRAARLLCECHPGTSVETPEAVFEFAADWRVWPFDIIIHPFLMAPEKIVQWGWLLGPRIKHAHVQLRARADSRRFLALEDDASRVDETLAALAEAGYTGDFALEFSATTGRPDETPESAFAAAARDLVFLRDRWEAV